MTRGAKVFGSYIVHELLGRGGMATVHRAEVRGLAGFSRTVALKRMLPSVANNPTFVRSFIREAQLANQLQHPNIAQIYDLGKVGDTYFIAMELVEGRNLREVLRQCARTGPMPIAYAGAIVLQLCEALEYAHSLGIIHRDVSPANVIISPAGVAKLIDFGIAKASFDGVETTSKKIKGKFSYMAPEYLTAGDLDSRADLFALGVIAHELLANRPLFSGEDDMDTLHRLKTLPIIPPSRVNPAVPIELDSIVLTALDRDPNSRWQYASALRVAFAAEIKAHGLVAPASELSPWIETAFASADTSRNSGAYDSKERRVGGGVSSEWQVASDVKTDVRRSTSRQYDAEPPPEPTQTTPAPLARKSSPHVVPRVRPRSGKELSSPRTEELAPDKDKVRQRVGKNKNPSSPRTEELDPADLDFDVSPATGMRAKPARPDQPDDDVVIDFNDDKDRGQG